MFAAMSEQPDFFRPRIKLFVAMAPVMYLKNTSSKVVKDVSISKKAMDGVNMLGNEVIPTSSSSTPAKVLLGGTLLG